MKYYDKYLKYKNKYLELKNSTFENQVGGDIPYIMNPNIINLFNNHELYEPDEIPKLLDMEQYLNPI